MQVNEPGETLPDQQITPYPTPDAPAPTLRRLFFGDDGLRAGWSVALFLLILLLLAQGVSLLLVALHHMGLAPVRTPGVAQAMTPQTAILSDGLTFLALGLSAFLMAKIERRPFRRFGLTPQRMPHDLLAGLGWGVVFLSGLVGTLLLTHALAVDGIALHGRAAMVSGAVWIVAFVMVGLAEEFMTRGYLQYTVSRGVAGIVRALNPGNRYAHAWGFWVAAFLFSVCLFMLGHLGNSGETVPGILAVGLAGAVFAYSLWRTGSLWWAIGFHAAWDWAQTFLYGVSDSGLVARDHLLTTHPIGPELLSGGSTGPEGSLLAIPTLLLVGVVIRFTLPARAYFLTPDQQPPEAPTPNTPPSI